MKKNFKELRRLNTFEERFKYLILGGVVGHSTFGFDRYINQEFYRSREWKNIRNKIIIRDNGCDLGIQDRPIAGRIIVHHINPITVEDIENANECIFDFNNLICTSHNTSNAIHYGNETLLIKNPVERMKGDTLLWPKQTY
jgi:hypothetical protein